PFDVDGFLNDVLSSVAGKPLWEPAYDAYEDEQGFSIQAALPGMDRKNLAITIEDGVLTVKGQRAAEEASSKRKYLVQEIHGGPFSRSFRVPTNVDTAKVAAVYKEGMLTVTLPKREETKPRTIAIEAA
ncbi:MAG: Hsp20/alpha crystallin family protein, partial [Nitrospiraceae bacterium]